MPLCTSCTSTYNDNVVLVVMIETPVGIANAYEIASVPGVDVVLIGSFEYVGILCFFSAGAYPLMSDAVLCSQPASVQREAGR